MISVRVVLPLLAVIASAQTWTLITSPQPPARGAHAMAFDAVSGNVLLFGGQAGSTRFGDTWLWNGTEWRLVSTQNAPPPRSYHAMVRDPLRNQVVLFGGISGTPDLLGDTWVWNGSTWTRKFSATTPSPRSRHTMAWDPVSQRVILFGGHVQSGGNSVGQSNETWAWNGTDWQLLSPATSPPAEEWPAAVTDFTQNSILLLSGWSWNGSNWVKNTALTRPEVYPNTRPAVAWDGNSGRVIEFITHEVNPNPLPGVPRSYDSRTLAGDGLSWKELATRGEPQSRLSSALVWDPVRQQLVLFSGDVASAGTPVPDTWLFTYGTGCYFTQPAAAVPLVGSAGGALELQSYISAGCQWQATHDIPWINREEPTGSADIPVRIRVAANDRFEARDGDVFVSGRVWRIRQSEAPCPSSGPLPNVAFFLPMRCDGNTPYSRDYTFTANAGAQFAAQAIGGASDGSSFVTNAQLTLISPTGSIVAQTGQTTQALLPASGVINLASSGTWTLRVSISSPYGTGAHVRVSTVLTGRYCIPDVSLSFETFTGASLPASGGSVTVRVGINPWPASAGPGRCGDAVSTHSWWLSASPSNLAPGFHAVTLTAQRNYQRARSATVTIGGKEFTIQQGGTNCEATVSGNWHLPLSISIITAPAGLWSDRLRIWTDPEGSCAWDAVSSVSWVQLYPLSGTGPALVTYTVFPNFTGSARTGTLTVFGEPITVHQPASGLTLAQRYVQLLYFSFMGRMPTADEIAFQVSSGHSREQLALNFFNSEEFNRGGRFIAGLYLGVLNREAEYGGWLFQRNALSNAIVNQDMLVNNFLNGAEFIAKNGTVPNADLIRLLYRQILRREATAGEVAWREGLLAGGMTRVAFARDLLNSAEFRQGTNARLTAFLLYATILQRDPTANEMQNILAGLTAVDAMPDPTVRQTALRDDFLRPFVTGSEFNASLQ